MKCSFFACLLLSVTFCHVELQAQTLESITYEGITYAPEIPDSESYEIMKNTTNQSISEEILLKINLHRRADEDYLWVVDNSLEILIFKISL